MKLAVFSLLMVFSYTIQAQNIQFTDVRNIQVIGKAELEIIPDEIKIEVTLKERYLGKTKVTLEELQKQFDEVINALGISKESITLSETGGYYSRYRKRRTDVLASQKIIVQSHNFEQSNALIELLVEADITNRLLSKSHSDIIELQKQVRKNALKAAKAKASYLLETIDANIGKVLHVQEYSLNTFDWSPENSRINLGLNAVSYYDSQPSSVENFTPIKLTASISATFEIVD